MEYMVVIVAFLAIVVIYLCRKVHLLFQRVAGLREIVRGQYEAEAKILKQIRETLGGE
jgi:hypothetical protein